MQTGQKRPENFSALMFLEVGTWTTERELVKDSPVMMPEVLDWREQPTVQYWVEGYDN